MAIRVAVDAMGGDHAPRAIVRGAVQALCDEGDLELVLLGDQARIEEELEGTNANGCASRIRVIHAGETARAEARGSLPRRSSGSRSRGWP